MEYYCHGKENKSRRLGTSLVVQWLRLQASAAGDTGWVSGQGPCRLAQKKLTNKNPKRCSNLGQKLKNTIVRPHSGRKTFFMLINY